MNLQKKHHKNISLFYLLKTLYQTRFYYPVFSILFIDHGITIEEFSLLNGIWALTIVLFEVPSGAISDLLGPKKLIIFAFTLMTFEMGFLLLAPMDGSGWVFPLLLLNRFLSGVSEASLSGADESLAYATLKKDNREQEWGDVLSKAMAYGSISFVVSMVLGGMLYDRQFLQTAFSFLPFFEEGVIISKSITIKLPVLFTFLMALIGLIFSFQLKSIDDGHQEKVSKISALFKQVFMTGLWILKTPSILMIIVATMFMDHVIRVFMTMSSNYYRLIELPESFFGIIAAVVGALGIFTPKLANKMAKKLSRPTNFFLLVLWTSIAFWGITVAIPLYGAFFVMMLGISMSFVAFFASYYINHGVENKQRATVLSFKGLFFNLMYGLSSFAYAHLIHFFVNGTQEENFAWSLRPMLFIFIGGAFLTVFLHLVLNLRGFSSEGR